MNIKKTQIDRAPRASISRIGFLYAKTKNKAHLNVSALRFGIGEKKPETLRCVAKLVGLSPERVRMITSTAVAFTIAEESRLPKNKQILTNLLNELLDCKETGDISSVISKEFLDEHNISLNSVYIMAMSANIKNLSIRSGLIFISPPNLTKREAFNEITKLLQEKAKQVRKLKIIPQESRMIAFLQEDTINKIREDCLNSGLTKKTWVERVLEKTDLTKLKPEKKITKSPNRRQYLCQVSVGLSFRIKEYANKQGQSIAGILTSAIELSI